MRCIRALAASGCVAAVLTSCGGSGHHRVRVARPPSPRPAATGTPRVRSLDLPPAARPGAGQLGADPQAALFVNASYGFVLVRGGIEHTSDGGRSWTFVWRDRGVQLSWIGRDGASLVASGSVGSPGSSTPVLLRSPDRGVHWALHRVRLPMGSRYDGSGMSLDLAWPQLELRFVSRSEAFAFTNSEVGQEITFGGLLRSTDGGLHWTSVQLGRVRVTGGLAFARAQDGELTASNHRCGGEILSTHDGGRHWHPVPGTCVPYALETISFESPNVGFAAGGGYAKYDTAPQLAVLKTTDAGRTWHAIYKRGGMRGNRPHGPYGPFASIQFDGPSRGYALVGGCTDGANLPCPGDLWVSDDGGRAWQDTGRAGTQFTLAAPQDVWLIGSSREASGGPIWHSSDAGEHWQPVGDSATVAIADLAAGGSFLFADTDAGDFASRDAGVTWQAVADPALRALEGPGAAEPGMAVVEPGGLVIADLGTSELWVSRTGGRSGRFVKPPGADGETIMSTAFVTPERGLALAIPTRGLPSPSCTGATTVFATSNGGRHWQAQATLPFAVGLPGTDDLAADASAAIATGPLCPSGLPVAVSQDGGATWTERFVPGALYCQPAITADLIALLCVPRPSLGGAPLPAELLISRDGARSFTTYSTSAHIAGVVATEGRLWLYGTPGTLWTSADAGAHWATVTPRFPLAG